MPNRSLNKRKISDSPPFVGMRAGAVAGSWIEDYSLGIDSTILGTSNPPSLPPVRRSFLNNFFVTETQYFSDMWGDANFRFQILLRVGATSDFSTCFLGVKLLRGSSSSFIYCPLKLFSVITRDLVKLLCLKTCSSI